MKFKIDQKAKAKLFFVALFVIVGLVAFQVPVTTLAGSRVKFTLFDLFAPVSGAFLGTPLGIISVIAMQAFNLILHGFSGVDQASFLKLLATLRFLPMLFGVWFFANTSQMSFWGAKPGTVWNPAKRLQNQTAEKGDSGQGRMTILNSIVLIAPLFSIVIFNLHPIGRTVWFYSLFWVIPFLVWPFRERFLVLRSLGATMTAHAVGGAIWIWAFNLPANIWVSLIPVVILERSIFALSISASYILLNNVLAYLSSKRLLPFGISFDKKYILRF